jgi:hypothetical protein
LARQHAIAGSNGASASLCGGFAFGTTTHQFWFLRGHFDV